MLTLLVRVDISPSNAQKYAKRPLRPVLQAGVRNTVTACHVPSLH